MVKVRICTEVVGKPTYHVGQIVDMDPRKARAWIEDGLAKALRPEELEDNQ
jgi:hypothetical protein